MGWSMRIKLLSLLFLISFATGQGSSLSFDGVDDYVALPDIDLLGNYPLSMTYKPPSHDDYNSLFNKYPAYALLEGIGSGSLYAHPKEGYDCSTGQNVSLNEWHNVSLVFNSGEMHFYVDGDLIHSCDDMPKEVRLRKKEFTVMGNVALYGATGGSLYVSGRCGERFALY